MALEYACYTSVKEGSKYAGCSIYRKCISCGNCSAKSVCIQIHGQVGLIGSLECLEQEACDTDKYNGGLERSASYALGLLRCRLSVGKEKEYQDEGRYAEGEKEICIVPAGSCNTSCKLSHKQGSKVLECYLLSNGSVSLRPFFKHISYESLGYCGDHTLRYTKQQAGKHKYPKYSVEEIGDNAAGCKKQQCTHGYILLGYILSKLSGYEGKYHTGY